MKKGDPAGSMGGRGYLKVKLNRKMYYNHRIIFFLHHGYMPEYIDHIDGDPLNNNIENLRACDKKQNSWNRKALKNTKSGIKGVCPANGKWQVYCGANGKSHYIGLYDNIKEAEKAAKEARKRLHGEFANYG